MEATGWIQAPEGGTARLPVQRPRSAPLLRLSSDERLVARIRAGNEAAFETLFERYRGPLLSFCRHMLGSQEDAEDAVQLAFTNAYRDILRSDRDLYVRPWLYRIARNQCITTLRNRRPQAPFARDQLVAHARAAHDQRLQQTVALHRLGERCEGLRLEVAPRLLGIRDDVGHRDGRASGRCGRRRSREQRLQALPQRFPHPYPLHDFFLPILRRHSAGQRRARGHP